jgi:hypothetical protein
MSDTKFSIKGTLETVPGCALASVSIDEGGEIQVDYLGETDVWWDDQKGMLTEEGQRIFVGEDGLHYSENELRKLWGLEQKELPVPREILKTFVVSTAHVEEMDLVLLCEASQGGPPEFPGLVVYDLAEGGYLVYLDARTLKSLEETPPEEHETTLSSFFLGLCKIALSEGCVYLRLDGSGPTYKDLPVAWRDY